MLTPGHTKPHIIQALCLSLCFASCGDDSKPVRLDTEMPVLPISEVSIEPVQRGEGPGHWPKSARATPADQFDFQILSSAKDEIEGAFSTLVINIPLIDKITNEECLTGMRAEEVLPARRVPPILDEVAQRGLSFDRVVVQVELYTPQRTSIHYQCIEGNSGGFPSYFINEIRQETVSAFKELARLSEVDAIVVGLELNTYDSLSDMIPLNREIDYANLISLYQDIYRGIKSISSDIRVGPSVSWGHLQNVTRVQLAERYQINTDDLLSLELALRATIWPLLKDQDEITADFIGVAIIPQREQAPYFNNAFSEDQEAIRSYYQNLPLIAAHPSFAEPLPIALTSIDWLTDKEATGGEKTDFLQSLKASLSHVSPDWVAWRRLSNILTEPPSTSSCRAAGNQGHLEDFCYAGLLTDSGLARTVWDEFTIDP